MAKMVTISTIITNYYDNAVCQQKQSQCHQKYHNHFTINTTNYENKKQITQKGNRPNANDSQ